MIIIPKRTMFLDGRRVERAVAVDVSDSEGDLAVRHGWAVEGAESDLKKLARAAKAAAEAEAKAAAEAEAKAAAEAEAGNPGQ